MQIYLNYPAETTVKYQVSGTSTTLGMLRESYAPFEQPNLNCRIPARFLLRALLYLMQAILQKCMLTVLATCSNFTCKTIIIILLSACFTFGKFNMYKMMIELSLTVWSKIHIISTERHHYVQNSNYLMD